MTTTSKPEVLHVREFDLEMINPSTANMYDPSQGGSKVVLLGRPGTGKTYAITSILYYKRHIFPYALVVSGTESSNGYWSKHFPEAFIYDRLTPDTLERFVERQKKVVHTLVNPWSVLLLDDCADEKRIMNGYWINNIMKMGRHFKMLFLLSLQYAIDVNPAVRANVDYCFIFRENRISDRKRIFDNYAAAFPDFKTFCKVLDEITDDDHTALVIRNSSSSNKFSDCVFWFKARPFPEDFKFGSPAYWKHSETRTIRLDSCS